MKGGDFLFEASFMKGGDFLFEASFMKGGDCVARAFYNRLHSKRFTMNSILH